MGRLGHSRIRIILGVLTGLLSIPTGAAPQTEPEPVRGDYSYEELVDMGLPAPNLGSSGLETCQPDPGWQPPRTEEELLAVEETAEDAPECVADRRTFTFSVGYPPPHADYHWNGASTTVQRRGGQASIEGGNPDVDHTSTPEFVVGRVLAENDSVEWLEIGSGEVSWRDDGPELYTFDDASGVWSFPSGYPLEPAEFVRVRVHDCDGNGTCALIYWDGVWNRVAKVTHVKCYSGRQQQLLYRGLIGDLFGADRLATPEH